MLGRFLELSLPAPRILESWQWYQRLGFATATDGGVWPHRYAALTDGRIALGLHDAALAEPWLTWVRPGLAAGASALAAGGIEFGHVALGDETFNEVRFATPDGHGVRLLEARTYSMPAELPVAPLGWFEEIVLPVRDLAAARDYWERIGFVTAAEGDEPWPWLALTSDSISLSLHATGAFEGPALMFSTDDREGLLARLAAREIVPQRMPRSLDPARHAWLRAPEGTTLWIAPPPA